MTIGNSPRRRENAFTLVKHLVSGGVTLAKLEVRRGREEMARNLGQLKTGILLLAFAAAIGLVFLIALVAFVMAVLVVIGLWWVALILLFVLVLVAGLLGWNGIKRVTSTKYTPQETIAAIKEDVAWAKTRLLKRD